MKENRSCCSVKRSAVSIDKQAVQAMKIIERPKKHDETMVYIPGGDFLMGSADEDAVVADGETPVRRVTIAPFYMDATTVTNEKFHKFIEETGYITEAEMYDWSYVFHSLLSAETAQKVSLSPRQTPWWSVVEGATWRHPEGPDSTIHERLDHPVIHVSWNDAQAYCKWAQKRLPTDAEWEFAARGGLEQKRYAWGNELTPGGVHQCNIFQGVFPRENTVEDGYISTAPVKALSKNDYGLFQVTGNVWEWCSDWFSPNVAEHGGVDNPQGAREGSARVMRGGSYLCHDSYCNRYRVAARTANTPDSSTGNIGFRCVRDI